MTTKSTLPVPTDCTYPKCQTTGGCAGVCRSPPAGKVADTILTDEKILTIAAPFLSDDEGFLRKPELYEVVAFAKIVESEVRASLVRSQQDYGLLQLTLDQTKERLRQAEEAIEQRDAKWLASRSQPQGEPVAFRGPDGKAAIEILRRAMTLAGVQDVQRGMLTIHFSNEWNNTLGK